MNATPTPVAFIGLGLMGGHMAGHILAAGHPSHVYNRTRIKADALVARGAIWHDDPGAAATAPPDVVITIVGLPRDVEEIYLGARAHHSAEARPGAFLVDMTTSSPSLAKRIAAVARAKGLGAIDAPVSGGDAGARDAKLSIMIGGEEADVAAVMPILAGISETLGDAQHGARDDDLIGELGMLAGAGTALATDIGTHQLKGPELDPNAVLASIGTGAAGSFLLNMSGPRMVNRDFAAGFFVEHLIKDLRIAREEAVAAGLDLKGLITALGQYTVLAEHGGLRDGTQALIKVYD